jgi:Na+/proline symporter
MTPDIDIIIFIAFLVINLLVGLKSGKKVKTIQDYALGGRNFSTGALVATIVATWASGSGLFVTLSNTYSDGLYYLIPSICMSISLVITAYLLVPRMGEFLGSTSVAEAMGNLYGIEVRLITAVCGILGTIGVIAVQFKVFGNVFNYFLGIDSIYALLLASTIVILYSTFGGIRAVTYTDVIQFFTFGFVLPTIAVIIWNHLKSLGFTVEEAIKNPLFSFEGLSHLEGYKLVDFILLALYFVFPKVGPINFQRISMASSISQARKAWLIASVLLITINLIIAWIPFLVLTIKPNLEPNQVTSYLIDNYTNLPLIKGLLIIGVSAMAMSSADSFINGSAVLFGYDVKEVLNIKVNDLVLSRLFSFVLGLFAIYLALSTNDLLAMGNERCKFLLTNCWYSVIISCFWFSHYRKISFNCHGCRFYYSCFVGSFRY